MRGKYLCKKQARSTQVRIDNIRIKVRYMGTTDTDTYLNMQSFWAHLFMCTEYAQCHLCTSKITSLQLMTEPLFCVKLYTVL